MRRDELINLIGVEVFGSAPLGALNRQVAARIADAILERWTLFDNEKDAALLNHLAQQQIVSGVRQGSEPAD
jgi:hypothetical protein